MYLIPIGRPRTDTEIFMEDKPILVDIGPKSSLNKTTKGQFSGKVRGEQISLVNVGTIPYCFVIPLESIHKMSNNDNWNYNALRASTDIGRAIRF